jgi:undecaprenyl diphosphate synthase
MMSTPIKEPASAVEADTGLLPAPHHVAVIMDGNGRWAGQRNLPRSRGHEAGAEAVAESLKGCEKYRIPYLTLYAFSYENWKRPKSETDFLMNMLEKYLTEKSPELREKNVRLRTIGDLDALPTSCRKKIELVREQTAGCDGLTLIFALNYGSRREITEATRRIARQVKDGLLDPQDIEERTITENLYTADFPDPDLLIRTSGEMRISNFLLWQISYAEQVVTPTLWPDFTVDEFSKAIESYRRRKRRFGGIQ